MTPPSTSKTRAGKLLQRLQDPPTRDDVAQRKWDREQAEHGHRGWVLKAVFLLLLMEIAVLSAAWIWASVDKAQLKDLALLVLSPTFTLFGTIVGFYFSRP